MCATEGVKHERMMFVRLIVTHPGHQSAPRHVTGLALSGASSAIIAFSLRRYRPTAFRKFDRKSLRPTHRFTKHPLAHRRGGSLREGTGHGFRRAPRLRATHSLLG